MSGLPFQHVDPLALAIPSDDGQVRQFLGEIKDVLVAINHNLATLIGQVGINTTDLATVDANHKAMEGAVANIETVLLKTQADLQKVAASSGTSGISTGGSKKPRLAEPAKFDGSDKNKAVSFRVAVSHYLRVSYPGSTVDEQIAFIISCLDGKAHEWLDPYLEDDVVKGKNIPWLHDLDDFWSQFNARWSVQNRTENFRAKLRSLTQKKSVQEYFKDFQVYSQGLGYNDISLRDMFYDGLSIKIKEMLMAQDFDHNTSSVTLQSLAERALKIDQRLEQFAAQNKSSSSSSSSNTGSKASTSPSAAAQGAPRDKLSAGEKVYAMVDGKARKGTLQSIGRNAKGKTVPTVKWDDGKVEEATFRMLNKDNHPASSSTPKASSSSRNNGPAPMDLDSAGSKGASKRPVICSTCGGKGHYANQCPSKPYSGQEAHISDSESEKEDL